MLTQRPRLEIANHVLLSRKYFALPLILFVLANVTGFTAYPTQIATAAAEPVAKLLDLRGPEAELSRLTAPDGTLTAEFGTSMDMDGDTIVVGAPFSRDASNVTRGAVYIYTRTGSNWTFQAKLDAPAGSSINSGFGRSVSISGNTIVVGASSYENASGASRGTAWVYVRSGETWSFQQQLLGLDAPNGAQFGFSVDISGETIAVGAREDVVNSVRRGAGYVFVRSGTAWSQQARLTDDNGNISDSFGYSISISGDSVIVGVRQGDIGGLVSGIVCVYTRTASTWTRQARFAASDPVDGDFFGQSVALEGDTAVVGAHDGGPAGAPNAGAAYVFVRDSGVWTQAQKLVPENLTGVIQFGTSVAISGSKLIVGDPRYSVGGTPQGAAYLFVKNGGTWQLQNKLTASQNTVADDLGTSVTIQGNRFFAGAPGVDIGENNGQGAAYFFIQAPFVPDLQSASDSGVSNSDNITRLQNISFDVGGITPGATVELLRNNVVVDSKVVAGTTTAVTDAAVPVDGVFQYTSRQIVSGEVGAQSEPLLITIDTTVPAAFLNQTIGQQDPTSSGQNVIFQATFNEAVTLVDPGHVTFAGSTANVSNATITLFHEPTPNFVIVNNVVSNGQVLRVSLLAGAVTDLAGNPSAASLSADNTVTIDNVRPTVTVDQATGQADPTATLPINYTVVFSEPVNNFDSGDLITAGTTANINSRVVNITGGPTTYNVSISNITSDGQVVRISLAGGISDPLGNPIFPSTSTDNTITIDNVAPTVTSNQAPGQADPTSTQPINFRVVFSENTTGFDASDVSLATSSSDTSHAIISVSGSGPIFNVAVSNIVTSGQVRLTVLAGAAIDALGNQSVASTSTDNSVTLQIPVVADIAGRVTNGSGRGLDRVRIVINLPGGETRYTQTNPFGYYRFIGAPTGGATVTVSRKNAQTVSQSFFLVQNLTGFDFVLQ